MFPSFSSLFSLPCLVLFLFSFSSSGQGKVGSQGFWTNKLWWGCKFWFFPSVFLNVFLFSNIPKCKPCNIRITSCGKWSWKEYDMTAATLPTNISENVVGENERSELPNTLKIVKRKPRSWKIEIILKKLLLVMFWLLSFVYLCFLFFSFHLF